MDEQSERSDRLRARVALAGLLIMIGSVVGFGIYFWDAGQPAVGEVIKLEPGDQPGGRGGGLRRAIAMAQADGVRQGIGNAFTVRGGEAQLAVRYREEGQPATYNLTYRRPPRVEGDVRMLITARTRIVQSSSFARSVGISREQVDELRKIRNVRHDHLHASDADLERLKGLADAYAKAPEGSGRKRAEEALVAAVREVGTRRLDDTRKFLSETGAAVAKVLTPEQIEKYRKVTEAERK
jgi:hypothetical protein